MGKCIAIVNQKGGVGKTTTTVNLAAGLKNKGKSVICIEADSQGSLSICLGLEEPDEEELTLAELMFGVYKTSEECTNIFDKINIDDYVWEAEEGFNFIPGNIVLQDLAIQMTSMYNREYILKKIVDELKERYDYILIDSPPSLGLIMINVLTAADSVIIPVMPQKLSTKGLAQLYKTISRVINTTNPNLDIDGILITMIKSNSKYNKNMQQAIEEVYGKNIHVYEARIPNTTRLSEIAEAECSIFSYDAKDKGAIEYSKFIEEVIKHGN